MSESEKTGLVWKLTFCDETGDSPRWVDRYYATREEAESELRKLNRRECSGAYVAHAPE